MTDEQKAAWSSELLKRFGDIASTITIGTTNKKSISGKLLARRCDYDFGKNREIKSYLVLADGMIVYVAPADVAQTADHKDEVRIIAPGNSDRR